MLSAQERMARRATEFLDSLSAEQRRHAVRGFADAARRDWHYVPRQRPGLPLKAMTDAQRGRAWALAKSALSDTGYRKALGVVDLEGILGVLTDAVEYRDPDNYAFLLLGDPASAGPWGWRVEGHHLSLNFTAVPGEGVSVTPGFFGANPDEVPGNHPHAGLRVLPQEQDLAFALLQGLAPDQRATAVIADRTMGDILTGPGREQSLRVPEGLAAARMTEAQREGLVRLVGEYLGNMKPEFAERQFVRLREAGVDALHLAWAGSIVPGKPHYYRIHGPTLIIEYDNSRNEANHAHSVWHDPLDDFGEDLLRRHHETEHGT